jgi:nitroimidazol reductase NimA-like FMN-containing flavoprotein (pyridoxamine 5'-phosphate oxidase superfamily)
MKGSFQGDEHRAFLIEVDRHQATDWPSFESFAAHGVGISMSEWLHDGGDIGSRTVTNDDIARSILDAGIYVVLATADAEGVPWASPVWFATEDYRELYWVSYPGARHSQNIAVRPQIAMVVFDSTVPSGTGQAVYMTAIAEQLSDPAAIEHGIEVFSRESVRQGGQEWGLDRVTGEGRLRLYRASVQAYSILDPDVPLDVRVDVRP